MCPLRSYENFAISNLICTIWWILFSNNSERRKSHDLAPFPMTWIELIWFSAVGTMYGLILEWNIHLNLFSVTIFSLAFSVSSSFFSLLFINPLFRVSYNFLTVPRGCFTPILHLSLLLSSPFLPFFSSFFSFSSLLSFFPPLSSFSLSSCRFLVRRPPPCRTASDGPELFTIYKNTSYVIIVQYLITMHTWNEDIWIIHCR